jgi:hypothetical protein
MLTLAPQASSNGTFFDSLSKIVVGSGSVWFWSMIQAIVVAVSLYLIYRQLRAQRLANTLTTLKAMDSRWNDGRLAVARSMICSAYPSADTNIDFYEEDVLTFLEELGIYVKSGAFDIHSVWDLYSYYIEHYWPILEPKVKDLRAVEQDDSYYEKAEWLYGRICKQSIRRKARPRKTAEQLSRFAHGECTFAAERIKGASP